MLESDSSWLWVEPGLEARIRSWASAGAGFVTKKVSLYISLRIIWQSE